MRMRRVDLQEAARGRNREATYREQGAEGRDEGWPYFDNCVNSIHAVSNEQGDFSCVVLSAFREKIESAPWHEGLMMKDLSCRWASYYDGPAVTFPSISFSLHLCQSTGISII
eukprot:694392-Hanusia_phi.AAC.1